MKKYCEKGFWYGVLLMAVITAAAWALSTIPAIKALRLSPLIMGIILGMVYANTLRSKMPASWEPGLKFCTKQVLRTGIVLYGFRLTLLDVMSVGLPAIVVDCIVIAVTIFLGIFLGKMLKMDADTALMTATGSAICGAAAVLGAEPVVKCESHKTAVAVSTVVIFGIIAMFVYPIMYRAGLLDGLDNMQVAIYTGSTLHEVANVAGAGNAMDPTDALGIAGNATITKMIRVILLAPVLIIMAFCLKKPTVDSTGSPTVDSTKTKITIPWFAFGFVAVIILTTVLQNIMPEDFFKTYLFGGSSWMGTFDTFLLAMAMTALGADTTIAKFRQAGAGPFYLASLLFIWLIVGGYLLARFLVPVLG